MRKFGIGLLAVCMLFSLTACGDKKTDDTATVTEATTETAADSTTEAATDSNKDSNKESTTEAKKDTKTDSKDKPENKEDKTENKTEATTQATTAASTNNEEAPTTAQATGATITLYYQDGSKETLSEDSDGTYLASNGARYYLGEDGVYRARGYEDLYTSMPEVSNPTVKTVTAFYDNGTTEALTEQGDGTWKAPNGAVYYLGEDGVYRANGFQDLYTTNPAQ